MIMQAVAVQPAILIQTKDMAIIISAICGAVIAMSTVIYQTYKLGARAFGKGVELHVKPLMEQLTIEIRLGVDAVKGVQQTHAVELADFKEKLAWQESEMNRAGIRLDEHDDELGEHETRISVLESRHAPIPYVPMQERGA